MPMSERPTILVTGPALAGVTAVARALQVRLGSGYRVVECLDPGERSATVVFVSSAAAPMADADAAVLAHWRAGMAALAANPHVCVKASMLSFIREGWTAPGSAARAEVAALVHEVVALFGARRVMFASNFPVDKVTTGALADVYAAFRDIAQRYSDEERRDLFANTAARAYGLPEVE